MPEKIAFVRIADAFGIIAFSQQQNSHAETAAQHISNTATRENVWLAARESPLILHETFEGDRSHVTLNLRYLTFYMNIIACKWITEWNYTAIKVMTKIHKGNQLTFCLHITLFTLSDALLQYKFDCVINPSQDIK